MGKQEDLVAAVKDQDVSTVLKLTGKATKSKLIGSAKKLNFNQVDSNGFSLLHYAAASDNIEIVKILIDHGATVDAMDSQGVRPLHIAARQGNLHSVDYLISCGSSVNDPAFDGSNPLHMACELGHLETVEILLSHHGDPASYNREHKTAFDVACEFGHLKIVEKLVCSPQCGPLIRDNRQKAAKDIKRTTCLHLATKNGHIHILRFLLEAGFDLGRQTAQGNCLHEAVLNGQIKTAKFLLDWGIFLHSRNSFNQTALDIVHSSQRLHPNEKLLRLLTEAPFQPLTVRAVRSYHCPQQHNQLSFREGDLIRVVERHSDEIWKGYLFRDSDEVQQHVAYFPSSEVEIMRASDLTDDGLCSIHFTPAMSTNPLPQFAASHHHQCLSPVNHHLVKLSPVSSSSSLLTNRADRTAEWIVQSADVAVTECSSGSPMSSKDNVSESNRSSTSSSSESSGYLGSNSQVNASGILSQPNRLSGQSCESGVASLWPSTHCLPVSTSRSSHNTLDWLDESGHCGGPVNVNELFLQGLKDSDIMYVWLHQLQLTECYQLFVQAGYDMPTISRMTPEDLTAIGITQPSVRKHLTSEISRLNLNDKIPNVRSNNLLEWLQNLNLEEYHATLMHEGYTNIDQILEITWEDLEDVGIHKLGHQKKLLLAIDRIKKLISGKSNDSELSRHSEPPKPSNSETSSVSFGTPRAVKPGNNQPAASSETNSKKDEITRLQEAASGNPQLKNVIRLPPQTPFVHPSSRAALQTTHGSSATAPSSEMISIHVNHRSPNSRTGSVKERSGERGDVQQVMYKSFHGNPSKDFGGRRVDSDGDMTPTNDRGSLSTDEAEDDGFDSSDGGRLQAMAKLNRRSSAGCGISGVSAVDCHPSHTGRCSLVQSGLHDPHFERNLRTNLDVGIAYNSAPTTPSHSALGGSPAGSRSKKIGPQPPKRSNSIKDKSTTSGVKTVNVAGAQDPSYVDVSKANSASNDLSGLIGDKSKQGNCLLSELDNPLSRVIARLEWKDDQVVRPSKVKPSDVVYGSASSQLSLVGSDCNTLPFANENIGTIKQRYPGKSAVNPSGDLHNFHGSPGGSSSSSPGSKRSTHCSESAGSDGRIRQKSGEAKRLPPVPNKKPIPGKNEAIGAFEQKMNLSVGAGAGGQGGADVFDDIDNLFQGLTQELNQMLTFNG